MLHLDNVPREDMPEVVRIASELYVEDQSRQGRSEAKEEEEQARKAYVDAAAEMDIPVEYLQRGAAELQARRVERIKRQRRRRVGIIAGVCAVLGVGLTTWAVRRATQPVPTPPAMTYHMQQAAEQWTPNINPQSSASISFAQDGTATVLVKKFVSQPGTTNYFVNLDTTSLPRTLTGYRDIRFKVRGTGLPNIRVYLENGPTERWRSRALPVSSTWEERSVRLDDFELQRRATSSDTWRVESYRPPEHARKLSFKLGSYVNDVSSSGEVSIREPRFE
jgi:hypothetical protein